MNKILMLILSSHLFFSCSSPEQYNERALNRVKISDRLPPGGNCKEVEVVYAAENDSGDNLEEMMRKVRRKLKQSSIEAGGNYVRIETNNTTTSKNRTIVVLSGTSYLCTAGSTPGSKELELRNVPPNPAL